MGWNCKECTYYHHAGNAQFCAMCSRPRVSNNQKLDFITKGIPIADDNVNEKGELLFPSRVKGKKRKLADNNTVVIDDDDDDKNDEDDQKGTQPTKTTVPEKENMTEKPPPQSEAVTTTTKPTPLGQTKTTTSNTQNVKVLCNPYAKKKMQKSQTRGAPASVGAPSALPPARENSLKQSTTHKASTAASPRPQQAVTTAASSALPPTSSTAPNQSTSHRAPPSSRTDTNSFAPKQPPPHQALTTASDALSQQTPLLPVAAAAAFAPEPPRPTLMKQTSTLPAPDPFAPKRPPTHTTEPTARSDLSLQASKGSMQKTLYGTNVAKPAPVQQRKQPPVQQRKPPPPARQPLGRVLQYKPGPVPLDPVTKGEWIFPTNYPKREYQFAIAKTALEHNTLVGLPTGLGKTLIAAVVMYNYYRWFPSGKVVFMAPTLPLVHQQVEACHKIMGIPEKDTAVLTGKIHPDNRKDVWEQRRAFFCTPETMQRDIDNERVDPKHFVLVVLDEAHRARGKYAYNRIVEQLNEGKAQFRVLGLSATPGSQIKTIQEVVDSLKINRLECRSDEDPDVTPYVHNRETEVFIVKKESCLRKIEQRLNDLLEPAVNALRRENAWPYNSHNTVQSYLVLKARREFFALNNNKQHLYQTFEHVRELIELRHVLNRQGIGQVRAKLTQIRDTRGKSKFVQSREFQELMQLVLESSFDPKSEAKKVDDVVKNNPKLEALSEVLVEHFKRAKDKNESSRAIVFSQFRDSVAEIEKLLQKSRPLVRPRHFIGQGNSTAKKSKSADALKGMKQHEQHQVIEQFRDNTFNVLVCTSIGEEGLDIGEVDLIVNFDCTISPVRSLQRVGRTGRKRNGRVVELVMEGPEEVSYRKGKGKENTIMRAMKNVDKFHTSPTIPMLPSTPQVIEQEMNIGRSFHLSQVEGHGEASKRQANVSHSSRPTESKTFRLSAENESKRAAVLGASNQVPSSSMPTPVIRKRLLQARSFNPESFRTRTDQRVGQVSAILRDLESSARESSGKKAKSHSRRSRASHPLLEAVFPLTADRSTSTYFDELCWGKVRKTSSNPDNASRLRVDSTEKSKGEAEPPKTSKVRSKTASQLPSKPEGPSTASEMLGGPEQGGHRSVASAQSRISTEPEPGRSGIDPFQPTMNCTESHVANARPARASETDSRQICEDSGNGRDAEPSPEAEQHEEFVLPTQDSSSDEESDEEESAAGDPTDMDASNDTSNGISKIMSSASGPEPAPDSGQQEAAIDATIYSGYSKSEPAPAPDLGVHDEFILPTQSSSSEDESDDESLSATNNEEGSQETAASEPLFQKPAPKHKKRRCAFSPDDSPEKRIADGTQTNHSKRESLISLADTPEVQTKCEESLLSLTDTPDDEAKRAPADRLVDARDNADPDDIVCALCCSGESLEDNPLYLCDGPGNGVTCNVAVHGTCYSVNNLSNPPKEGDDPWYCEMCVYAAQSDSPGRSLSKLSCSSCNSNARLLTRLGGTDQWAHPSCIASPAARENKRARRNRLMKQRNQRMFLDEEAGVASDEDVDGDAAEERDVMEIEDNEELHSSFINDSSQLGYSPDALDEVDPDRDDNVHRAVDQQWQDDNQFKTPMLNRRMQRDSASSRRSATDGLGNMNFIRSVLEHHRNGGNADEIEAFYANLETEEDDPS